MTPRRETARSQLAASFGEDQSTGGLDHREMRERLREVAEVVTGFRVELFSVETERRRDPDPSLLQPVAGALLLVDDGERRDRQNEQIRKVPSLPDNPSVSSVR